MTVQANLSNAPRTGASDPKHLDPKEVQAPSRSNTTAPEGFSPPLPNGATPFLAFDGYLTWEVPGYPVGMVEIPQDEEDEAAEFLDREMYFREVAA